MFDISLTIGHNINGTPRLNTAYITKRVTMKLNIKAFTAFPCLGMWQGEAEQSTRIEICGLKLKEAEEIEAAIPELARVLKQQEIMFSKRPSSVQFIPAQTIEQRKSA